MVNIEQALNSEQPAALPSLARAVPRLAANAASIVSSDVLNRATTFVLYALVARFLSAREFGQLSLALTLFYTFQVLATAGLKTLVIREVARDRGTTGQYLVNGGLLISLSSVVSILVLVGFVRLMNYAADTTAVVVLIGIGLIPYAISTLCEAIIQAWEQMHYIVIVNLFMNTIKIAVTYLLLSNSHSLQIVLLVFMASYIITAIIESSLVLRMVTHKVLDIDLRFILDIIRSSFAFLGIDVLVAIFASTNVLLLSKLTSETELGLYSAAAQLLIPFTILFQSSVFSLFPMLCKTFARRPQHVKQILELLLGVLFAAVLPCSIGLYFLADQALALLYGNTSFLPAVVLLRIMSWSLVPAALIGLLGYALMAGRRERSTLCLLAIHSPLSLAAGVVLIHQFGAVGAAITLALDKALACLEHTVLVSTLLYRLTSLRLAWRASLAGIGMAGYLAVSPDQHLLVRICVAAALYVGLLLTLTIWSLGGPLQARRVWLQLRSRAFVAPSGEDSLPSPGSAQTSGQDAAETGHDAGPCYHRLSRIFKASRQRIEAGMAGLRNASQRRRASDTGSPPARRHR